MANIMERSWPASEADWDAAVEKALKGAPFSRLQSATSDGLSLNPLYAATSTAPLPLEATPWRLVQRVDQSDPAAANAQALDDLMNGAGGLELVFKTSPWAWFDGLDLNLDSLQRTLDGVDLSLIEVRLEAGVNVQHARDLILQVAASQGLCEADLRLLGGIDDAGLASYGERVPDPRNTSPAFDGRFWHAAGATPAQELALVLASVVNAIRSDRPNLDQQAVTLVADGDQFSTLAKFRSWRFLLARLNEVIDGDKIDLMLHGETAWRDLTTLDPHVNVLRSTTAALAAGVAGTNSLTVLPFTTPLGLPGPAARRLARNTQSILLEEASLAIVADPASGAGGFEEMTDALCEKVWSLFQAIEQEGGLMQALNGGIPQRWIKTAAAEQSLSYAHRKRGIVGTSLFANLGEVPTEVLSTTACYQISDTADLVPHRVSEPFEALHRRATAIYEKTGHRARVALVALGRRADFSARATFAKDLFQSIGLHADLPEEGQDANILTISPADTQAVIACIVAADPDLAAAAEVKEGLLAKGFARVLVACPPASMPNGFQPDDCVHLKTNALELGNALYAVSYSPDRF